MIEYEVDLSKLRPALDDVRRRQLPFATALALTATAGEVGLAWQDEMRAVLDRPTPFTLKSVTVIPARRSTGVAIVKLKDVAAQYLEPFVFGGKHFLGEKRGLLTPKNITLNAYGNLTRSKLATLKGRQNVFVGPVKLKSGQVVSGAWQRVAPKTGSAEGHLKLLIRFSDPLAVTQRLDLFGRADAVVRSRFAPNFAKAWARAQATAR